MNKFLIAAAEAGLLLTFATGAMAALFDPTASTLTAQALALGALLALGAVRARLNRGARVARIDADR